MDEITPRKMSSGDLATYLRRQITGGEFLLNERLPPERVLAEEFSVARGTVREALRQLEEMGFVERRAGSGTYVSYSETQKTHSIVETARPLELVDARFALEPQICRLAVLHARERDLQEIEASMKIMEGCDGDINAFAEGDEAFHLALARATHNSLLMWMADQINEVRSHAQWAKMRHLTLNADIIDTYNLQHRDIVDAIRAREPETAARRMRAHLETARRSLVDVPEQ